MDNEKKSRFQSIPKVIIIIVLSIIIISIVIGIFAFNNKETKINNTEQENNSSLNNNNPEEINNDTTFSGDLINYIEIEMPNLVGKTYMDVIYRYNLKDDILEQLLDKDLEGTTYNINTIKYLGDGSIYLNGFYIIEGYGYEVESQTPAAGTKIKLLNDGEGNVSLEEDIYLYIKGGGQTEKAEIYRDKRDGSSSNEDNNDDELIDDSYLDDSYLDDSVLR